MGQKPIIVIAICWMVLIVASVSCAITLALSGAELPFLALADQTNNNVYVTDHEFERIDRYARLDEVRDIIVKEYFKEVDEERLIKGAIDGMLATLDDEYSFYYTPDEMMSMNERSEGVYEGIGIILAGDKSGMLTVLRVFEGSPSKNAGVKPGDKLIAVDGAEVNAQTNKDVNDAIDLIKKSKQGDMVLTVLRGDQRLDLTVTKDTIHINRVDYEILDGNIGYLAIYEFMGDSVTGFKRAIEEFRSKDVQGMIIDLRSNPGGMLSQVVDIADVLLPEGIIVYIEDRSGVREDYYSDASDYDIPMVVLVNHMSASASEVLAGALKEYGVATIVGEQSYGKGIVQTVIPFRSDGAGMQLTTARYFTPKGNSIHEKGITPDIVVEQNPDYDASIVSVNLDEDRQLGAAYEQIKSMIGG